jgi:sugar/nucleoside kinase (ribokinase family)
MNDAHRYDALVIGELNVDMILNSIAGLPEIGKEILAGQMTLTLGSSSAIFASNLSALGAQVAFLGKIGKDIFGQLTLDSLQSKKVDTGFIIRDPQVNTGATVALNYEQDRAMITHPGAMEHLTLGEIHEEVFRAARHLHFSSYFLQPGLKPDLAKLLRTAKNAGMTTSVDMQWDPAERWDFDYQDVLPLVDVFLPNEQELLHLTAETSLEAGLLKLAPFANIVAVKMGRAGSLCWDHGQITRVGAFVSPVFVDAIGAGDSFNAGYIFKFLKQAKPSDCQRFANLMGALNTTAAGGTGAFTDYLQIMQAVKNIFGETE